MAFVNGMVRRIDMEILTLLKANIRRKKGTFISIVLLTTIITAVMTSIFSVRDNYGDALANALEKSDCGDVTVFIRTSWLTDELRENVENHKLVQKVSYYNSLPAEKSNVNGVSDGNSHFMLKMIDGLELFNEDLDGFEASIPKLNSGEIYLPLGLKSKLECNIGDVISYEMSDGKHEFIIKGFVQEPTNGAMTIGWKQVFISDEDYQNIYDIVKPLETTTHNVEFTMIRIHKAKDCELSAAKFQRQLNLDTKIIDTAAGALNEMQSVRYSTLLPDVVTNIVLVFVIFLFIIVLIVMSHSIGTEIEIDYVDLGVLKSQGFSKWHIRGVMILQYLLAQVVGIVIGSITAVPIEYEISKLCMSVTAILPDKGIAVDKSLLCMTIILLTSAILVLTKTAKVAKISPVRAISGGREEIYFSSRLNAPIVKKALSATLALRQFTSGKKRYIGTMLIVAILTFFMITVNLIGNLLSSRGAQAAMGLLIPDIEIFYTEYVEEYVEEKYREKAEQIIEENVDISEKNSMYVGYVSLNGENLMCETYKYPENIWGILKGRAPIYENEILITEMVAETLDLKMGDEVVVSFRDKQAEFIISGIFQSSYDSGMSFAMNFKGSDRIGLKTDYAAWTYYMVKDKEKLADIADEINEKYGDIIEINIYDEDDNPVTSEYGQIVDALKLIIYVFSILFAFVVVRMVCTKTFIQERTDIGIYKAMGFTSRKLRFSFAVRFVIVALIGSVIGTFLSVLFSGKMLGLFLSLIGLSKVVVEFTALSVLVPIAVAVVSFFVFAYVVSRKIRRVAVRELVVE